MIEAVPLPRGRLLWRGVLYRVSVPPNAISKRRTDEESLEVVRRVYRRQYREYLERRRRAS